MLQGDPVFHVDDRTFTLAKGDFVHIPMGTTHWFEVLDLADQGASRILSSRRGGRLLVGPGGRPDKQLHAETDRCLEVCDNRPGRPVPCPAAWASNADRRAACLTDC